LTDAGVSLNPLSIQVGQERVLVIEKPALGGHGLGRWDGMAVFVEGALPGQRILARITAVKSRHAWAEMLRVLDESFEFTPPDCPYFGLCGGCDWLHMDYARQLFWKGELVRETLRHLGGVDAKVASSIPSPVVSGYRNKMEFAFAPPAASGSQDGDAGSTPFVLGLRPRGQARQAVAVESCRLCSREMIRIRRIIGEWALESGLPAYDPDSGQGFWRHAVLREGRPGSGILVHLITSSHPRARDVGLQLAEHLQKHVPEIASLVHDLRKSRTLVAQGEQTIAKAGSGAVTLRLADLELTISSRSFFQSNTSAAEILYAVIRDFAGLGGRETVWDLYSGVGGIALFLAGHAARVVGLESVPQAVRDAQANARRNALANCRFLAGDAATTMGRALHPDPPEPLAARPDVIIADPPRAGMQPKVVAQLLKINAPKLILVSCNPATLARDIKLLSSTYDLKRVQPVDMFPHTSHIECVAELVAKPTL
jgi:23S rRNA (uracil1939-C5)-methyltransferase